MTRAPRKPAAKPRAAAPALAHPGWRYQTGVIFNAEAWLRIAARYAEIGRASRRRRK
ncbi:hypothetical protein QO010_000236 [Caulobacter ginsengisoli]|uniref:Uncharacterized protein n=1 Tax=Caulobacter ginsengisoli TaxID=400775 RepID=A0ABU0IKF4_9CAUL|nr:hypothetical protein [Caulobacter ginsengisoli]MDQ0462488.1 hypothetical protein [Caulobacter ginsengisoli]